MYLFRKCSLTFSCSLDTLYITYFNLNVSSSYVPFSVKSYFPKALKNLSCKIIPPLFQPNLAIVHTHVNMPGKYKYHGLFQHGRSWLAGSKIILQTFFALQQKNPMWRLIAALNKLFVPWTQCFYTAHLYGNLEVTTSDKRISESWSQTELHSKIKIRIKQNTFPLYPILFQKLVSFRNYLLFLIVFALAHAESPLSTLPPDDNNIRLRKVTRSQLQLLNRTENVSCKCYITRSQLNARLVLEHKS